jgi:quinol monooxygenase YgiN
MIIGTTKIDVHPGKHHEFVQTMQALVSEIRKERGCRGCSFYQDTEDENRFILREEWGNQEALDKHLRSHRYRVLVGAINLLSKKSDVNYSTTESSEANEARNDEDEN